MTRLHPSILHRLSALCRGAMSLSSEHRKLLATFVEEQVTEMDRARWALRSQQARILGEHLEEIERAPMYGTYRE